MCGGKRHGDKGYFVSCLLLQLLLLQALLLLALAIAAPAVPAVPALLLPSPPLRHTPAISCSLPWPAVAGPPIPSQLPNAANKGGGGTLEGG